VLPQSTIQVLPGAKINALQQNSYVAMVAPRIEQGGTVRVNGSAAYVAAEQLTMTLNQGLFDVQVDIGSGDPNGIVHTGETSGPASSGSSDRHVVYMVAVPKNDAMTMLLDGGKVGFDDAVSASVQNGQVILSAGYGVSGRSFDNADLGGAFSAPAASIDISGGEFTSSLSGAATGSIEASGGGGTLDFAGDVTLHGLNSATLAAREGETVIVGGDAEVSAADIRDFTTGDDALGIDAQGGSAAIVAEAGGTLHISGAATVSSDARAATNDALLLRGSATGGDASIRAEGGTISIDGETRVTANGFGGDTVAGGTGGSGTGGSATIVANRGQIALSNALASSNGKGGTGGTGGAGLGGSSFAGAQGGTLTASGMLTVNANGTGGDGLSGAGGVGEGGHSLLAVNTDADSNAAKLDAGSADLNVNGSGGNGTGAPGGAALGGVAEILAGTAFGTLAVDTLNVDAKATGGSSGGLEASADAGSILLEAINATSGESAGSMDIGSATLVAIANGGIDVDPTAGIANGGHIEIRADGGPLNFGSLTTNVSAQHAGSIDFASAVGSGGQAGQLQVGTLSAKARGEHGGSISVSADANTVANLGNAALLASGTVDGGYINLRADGEIKASSLALSSGGDIDIQTAAHGLLDVSGTLQADAAGTVNLAGGSVQAGVLDVSADEIVSSADVRAATILFEAVGDITTDDLTATKLLSLTAGGLAQFLGTASAPNITVTSSDIDIAAGASLGVTGVTKSLTLNAVSDGSPVVIGDVGGVAAGQYQLSGDEAFHASSVIFNAVGAGGAPDPDVLVGDFQIFGTAAQNGGIGSFTVNTDGGVRVDGDLQFSGLGAGDALTINAGKTIEVNTDSGSIALTGGAGELAGLLKLNADNIWIADAALLGQLEADPNFAGRDEALAAGTGKSGADGFVRAGGITALIGQTFLVQNGGTTDNPLGVTVGDAGLSISKSGASPATIVVYGREVDSNGDVFGGNDFLDRVQLGEFGAFTSNSTINGCDIGIGCILFVDVPAESILGPVFLMTSPLGVDDLVALDLDLLGLLGDDRVDEPVTSGTDPIVVDEKWRCSNDPKRERC
jgi:hypothetical protein